MEKISNIPMRITKMISSKLEYVNRKHVEWRKVIQNVCAYILVQEEE